MLNSSLAAAEPNVDSSVALHVKVAALEASLEEAQKTMAALTEQVREFTASCAPQQVQCPQPAMPGGVTSSAPVESQDQREPVPQQEDRMIVDELDHLESAMELAVEQGFADTRELREQFVAQLIRDRSGTVNT